MTRSTPDRAATDVQRVRANLRCPSCDGPLLGLRFDGHCRGCGTAVATALGLGHVPGAAGAAPRACLGCGYDLYGVGPEGRCPECGLPVRQDGNVDDPLSVMPPRVILRLAAGAWVAAGAVLLAIVAAALAPVLRLPSTATLVILAGCAGGWLAAVHLLTPALPMKQAVFYGFAPGRRLLAVVRALPLGLVAGTIALVVAGTWPKALGAFATPLVGLGWVGLAAGTVGVGLALLVLQGLAAWTRDAVAETTFNWAVWGLGLSVLIGLGHLRGPWMLTLDLAGLAVVLGTIGCVVLGLLSLARSVTLSLLHWQEHRERHERRLERGAHDDAEVAAAVARMDPPRPPG